ncbi:MAG: cysteine desulfurase [Rhodocyclaceae bacterium]|nr:cysteine desulfurase [Rhodocyclaceae bacterium]
MFAPVYLDHNATTPLDAAVLEAMLPFFKQQFGNASSRHEYGRAARRALDEARERVASAVGAQPGEVVFTSGGTEANNLFIKGAAANRPAGTIAISAIEHPCVREPAKALRRQGWRVREIGVDRECRLASADFQAALAERPALVSVMMANNETGAVQDIALHAAQCREATAGRAWFHSDAVQALGKLPIDFRKLNAAGVHALTLSAHKVGGPKGAGALVIDKRVDLAPLIDGGGHERGLRSGTENVPALVGFGVACARAVAALEERAAQLLALRGELERGLAALGATIFAASAQRLPNTVYFAFPAIDGETLVAKLDRAGYAVASGAACSSANPEPSHVLLAMGVAPELARGAVRVSLGDGNTAADVAGFLAALSATVSNLQSLAAVSLAG